ncbi:Short-chain dehydrogenase [Eubacterium ruminantium]|nr:Short-chain dehydrogenase [Eubacterium ruminantium]
MEKISKERSNKTVFITGASSGIGEAAAKLFAKQGCRVIGASRNCTEGTRILKNGGSITMIRMDVTDPEAVENIISRFPDIDTAVFAAGMGVAGTIEETPLSYAREQMETNYLGVLNCCKAVLPGMRARQRGMIIVVGSVAGRISIPMQSHYSSSKYALEALVDALRLETAPFGIKAAIIEPGDTKTGFTASRKTFCKKTSPYYDMVKAGVGQMEHDEMNGASAMSVARIILKTANKKNPPAKTAVGLKYKAALFLVKILPDRFREMIVRKLYVKINTHTNK